MKLTRLYINMYSYIPYDGPHNAGYWMINFDRMNCYCPGIFDQKVYPIKRINDRWGVCTNGVHEIFYSDYNDKYSIECTNNIDIMYNKWINERKLK